MRKIIGLCVLACCLCIFLAACSGEYDNNGEADSTINEGVEEMGDIDFDFENTARVLEELLGHPVTKGGSVVGPIRDAGIRGVIRAEWSEPPEPPRSVVPSFIIESEDNRVYRLSGGFSSRTGNFRVSSIFDVESGKTIYGVIK